MSEENAWKPINKVNFWTIPSSATETSPAFACFCHDAYEANVVYNYPFIKKIIE